MRVDLHNHSSRCKHAKGTVEEYVQKAISEKIDIFGFSDHAPMDFDPEYRMDFDQMREYEEEIRATAQKYAGTIDIRLGYEVDWLPGHMDKRVLEADVDYLIGSVHFLDGWGFDNPAYIGRYSEVDLNEVWQKYFAEIEAMAKSGLFDIVGHLDLIKIFRYFPSLDMRTIAQRAMDAIAAADMTIEINAAGYRKPISEAYPGRELLDMAYEKGIAITFGSDAHSPEQVGYQKDAIRNLALETGYTKAAVFKNRKRELLKF